MPPPRHRGSQETCQCHAEADSLTALDESAWQAEASVPGVPRRILPLRGLRRCGSPRRESSRQPELCTAVRMTAARRARREFLGRGSQETCQCHAEADSLTALDESAWQAEASVPGVPRRILRCGLPRRESSRQPELCTAVRMTAARRARREFLGSGYASQPAPQPAASDEVPAHAGPRAAGEESVSVSPKGPPVSVLIPGPGSRPALSHSPW